MNDTELAELISNSAAETRRHFDVVAEGLRHEIQLVAESVVQTREELGRTTADQAAKIERAVVETQAMIKFSHDELQRRVRTLEESVADLNARVERLEGSAH
jgi:gas vesicle protein